MKEPSLTTIKILFALSNNQCAFPRCRVPIIEDSGVITGKICHIKARNPSGPRYDSNQTEKERHSFSNLLLLCGRHHDIIDSQPNIYTEDIIRQMKIAHEEFGRKELNNEDSIFASILLNDYRRIHISNNKGTIIIDSPGAIKADKITIKTEKRNIKILPPEGTIAHDLQMKAYVKHLIDRYNEFAASDKMRKTKFSFGAIYKNINDKFGVKWDHIPEFRFYELVTYIQNRIDRTKQARINKGKGYKAYSSFDEFCKGKLKL